ncbi:MAG: hypothetical protein LBE61_09690 [Burkholderiaceae bacterium]|jgi:hypothetical protein|nr:hypothetical protein [Burkholderiaceae bacterium]
MATNYFDKFDQKATPGASASGGNFFDQFDAGGSGSDAGGTASDLAKSLKVGVQRLPGMATGLADLPFALANGSRPITKAAEAVGENEKKPAMGGLVAMGRSAKYAVENQPSTCQETCCTADE